MLGFIEVDTSLVLIHNSYHLINLYNPVQERGAKTHLWLVEQLNDRSGIFILFDYSNIRDNKLNSHSAQLIPSLPLTLPPTPCAMERSHY